MPFLSLFVLSNGWMGHQEQWIDEWILNKMIDKLVEKPRFSFILSKKNNVFGCVFIGF